MAAALVHLTNLPVLMCSSKSRLRVAQSSRAARSFAVVDYFIT